MNEARPVAQLRLPSVDQVLRTSAGALASARFGHDAAVGAIRTTVAVVRGNIRSGRAASPEASAIATAALELLEQADAPSLRRVFNLTGTVLHTNLGRAVLPECAIRAATDAMRSAVALEFDIGGAGRGGRDDPFPGPIPALTGAPEAPIGNKKPRAGLP